MKPVDVDDLLAVADPTPLAEPVIAPAAELHLVDTPIRLLRRDGPTHHTASSHELVITTTGTTGHLAPGEHLDVAQDETAYIATA